MGWNAAQPTNGKRERIQSPQKNDTQTYLLKMQCLDVACLCQDGLSCFLFEIKYEDYVQRMLPLLSQQSSRTSLFWPLAT